MQIIIEMPKDMFYNLVKAIKKSDEENTREYGLWSRIIANGTPLPEEHGDLIDRNKLLDWSYNTEFDRIVNVYDIKKVPAIIKADAESEGK